LQHTVKSQIASSLVTLLGTEKEIQFVTLEKLQSLLPDFSNVLQKHLQVTRSTVIIKTLLVLLFQVFFCKYNDPFYIKQAKLRVIMSLVTIDTVETVLSELKEYASEVDLDFVRQSVRAISSCAVRFEIIAEVAVQLLLELIGSQINYVVQEAIIAMKDIIRCYPNRFEHSVPVLCDALSTLDQPDAKAALIWMIGEYAPRIDNVNDLMEVFADSFMDEADTVQLQLITSAVKSFLKQKDIGSQNMAQHLLRVASNSENPDVRDRAFIYWRLLSSNTYSIEKVII
jgi:AP-1 complex subunit beta-1